MQVAHVAGLIRGLLLCGWACAAVAQMPTAPPADASTPMPVAAPVARPALVLAEPTVKTHVSHLFEKLSVTNRVQLAIAAFRAGLVD